MKALRGGEMRIHQIQCLVCLWAISTLEVFSQSAGPYQRQANVTQIEGMVRIDANSSRPLEQTLDALQQKYGWIVDYEDPQYLSHLDFVNVPNDEEHSEVPAGRNFSVQFPAAIPKEEKILQIVLEAYNRSQNPGQFELRHSDHGELYVVGMAAHDERGAVSRQQTLFDFPVTLATEERTIAETIDLICQAVGKQSHLAVTVGVYPRSLFRYTMVKVGGVNISARELLLQCFATAHHRLYWRLLFDPTSKSYFLDIHSLRPA
jgi:hypothetical protein